MHPENSPPPPDLGPFRAASIEVLQLLNEHDDVFGTLQAVADRLQARLAFDAVGLRLQNGDDFPYFVHSGFAPAFVAAENSLLSRTCTGETARRSDGSPLLECTCGLILSGRHDPAHPLFTASGSAWTNNSPAFLGVPATEDPRHHPRNRCIHQGYCSIALVPIRHKARIMGLLQLNDRRPDRLSLAAVEILEGIAAHLGAALARRLAELALKQAHAELERRVHERTLELERTNAVLQAREAQLRSLFSAMTEGFVLGEIICDAAGKPVDWRTLESNCAMERFTGVPTAERLSRTALEIAPDMDPFWIETFGRVALTGESAAFERYGKNTKRHWQMTVFCPAPGRFAALYQDITVRKHAEADQLVLGKLEAAGVLAGGIAHDYNNLLSAVSLGLDIVLAPDARPGDVSTIAGTMRESIRSARSLTQQLLSFTRGGPSRRTRADLPAILQHACAAALQGSALAADVDVPAGLWPLEVELVQIEQVFRNLVLNAREATTGPGTVALRAANRRLAADEVHSLPAGPYVEVIVEDHGHGIPAHILPSVFDPYFSTKPRSTQKGMGLGLTLSHAIVQRHGGCLDLESTEGVGTRVHVFLPALPTAPEAAAGTARP